MQLTFDLGVSAIRSYKRLSYTPWHAIAEFVDNSTQSYCDHQRELDEALADDGERFAVRITYEAKNDILRVADNAMGMSREELERALKVGLPPEDPSGRCEYGMGMKTAACWIGNKWTVRTKKLGEVTEYEVTVDVEEVAKGQTNLELREAPKDARMHYTVIEVSQHHHAWKTRTLSKIKDFLRSMYRVDLREGRLDLFWQCKRLQWDESDDRFVKAADGTIYRKRFEFEVNGKRVHGWVGVLERGSRAQAGFSILRRDRVVRGWPLSWRPSTIYGQIEGSNDLVNQRVTGEINLDDFTVSHTKDEILWMGDEEEQVERLLADVCRDYVLAAKTRRKGETEERGPSELEVKTALGEFQAELQSGELLDTLELGPVPAPEALREAFEPLSETVDPENPACRVSIGEISVSLYLTMEASPNDPYVAVDATSDERISVVINANHPHWRQLEGARGTLNYFRDCTYDAIAEWQARHKASQIDPDTIKLLKDALLRASFHIENHSQVREGEPQAELATESAEP